MPAPKHAAKPAVKAKAKKKPAKKVAKKAAKKAKPAAKKAKKAVAKKAAGKKKAVAKKAGKVWLEHGALQYVEAAGDDLAIKFGVPFTKLMKPKAGETIVVSYIVFKSRAHRDSVNAKVMADPRLNEMMQQSAMPFDVKRMVYGGFSMLVDL